MTFFERWFTSAFSVVALGLFLVFAVVALGRHKVLHNRLPRVSTEAFLLHRPTDVGERDWLASRDAVSRTLMIDADRLNPLMTLAELTEHFTWLGMSSVDVDWVLEDIDLVTAGDEIESVRTLGELVRVYALYGKSRRDR